MGFRFRKSFRIAPGIRLNLSKGGSSFSLGRRGATLNVGGKRGPRATVGIPGTGLSYTEQLGSASTPASTSSGAGIPAAIGAALVLLAIMMAAVYLA